MRLIYYYIYISILLIYYRHLRTHLAWHVNQHPESGRQIYAGSCVCTRVYVPSILDSASSIYARNLRSILLNVDENDGTTTAVQIMVQIVPAHAPAGVIDIETQSFESCVRKNCIWADPATRCIWPIYARLLPVIRWESSQASFDEKSRPARPRAARARRCVEARVGGRAKLSDCCCWPGWPPYTPRFGLDGVDGIIERQC